MILYTSLDRNFFNFNTVMIIVRVRDRLGGGGVLLISPQSGTSQISQRLLGSVV